MSGRNNVRKRGTTWTYYAYVTGKDGKRRQISKGGYATRRAAEAARIEILNSIRTGAFVRPERITLAQFIEDEWLPSQRPPTLEESTHRSYARYLRLHVIPYIGSVPLQALTPMDLNEVYRRLLDSGRRPVAAPARRHESAVVDAIRAHRGAGRTWQQVADAIASDFPEEDGITRHAVAALHRREARKTLGTDRPSPGLKPRTVRYVHTILHAALKDAMRWSRVARNVADAADPPSPGSSRSSRPAAWTAEHLGAFLDFIADNRYLPAWVFLATTGCRRGECLGLKWSDLDLDNATAVISRQVTAIEHELRVKELPKTKRGHMILLDSGTVAMLRRWRARQAEEKLLVGGGYRDDGFVFCQPDGSVHDPDRFSREFLRKQARFNRVHPNAPLPRLVLHGLRHTWATLALHEGIDIHIVSERLNHSSTHVTREIYTHVTPPMQSDAAEQVAASIFRRRAPGPK